MGNITQSRQRKPRYITVVQGNKIFRINTSEHQDTQQPMPTQPQPQQSSVLGSMLMGGSGGSGMLLQAATQQHGRVMRTAGNSSGKLRAIMLGTNSKKKGWWG